MGNFSKDPQCKLQESLVRHYVGVRLQQGVPILDADWNEMEDLRRWELWSLLKWFIGDGVPEGNDGFKIAPVAGGGADTIILMSKKAYADWSSVTINRTSSTAADVLGFGPQNFTSGKLIGSAPARVTSDAAGTFALNLSTGDKKLVVKADDLTEEEIVFRKTDPSIVPDIDNVPISKVIAVINAQAHNIEATAGQGGDFIITGGDGSSERAGRCLAGGWEALNETNLKYTSQALYNNDTLAAKLNVAKIAPLTTPVSRRTDTVYLDVWEREVDSNEDNDHLVDPRIGIETSVRIKREWAVRVQEGSLDLPIVPIGHVFVRLATIVNDSSTITAIAIRDGRKRTSLLSLLDLDKVELNNRVKILRNAIEHLSLRSTIDSVPAAATQLPNVAADAYSTANGFARLVDRFRTTASFNDQYHQYFAASDGTARVITQILIDTDKPIIKILVTDKSRILGSLPVATTVDVSLDGGTSFSLVNQPLDQDLDTQALPPNNGRYQLVLRFNLSSVSNAADVWITRVNLLAACSHLAAVAGANGRLYAVAGNTASAPAALTTSNTVSEYNDDTNTWSGRAALTTARRLLGVGSIRSFRLYALGGTDGTNKVGSVEEYDIKGNAWTTLAADFPVGTAREQLAVATTSDERIYAVGGLDVTNVRNLNQEFNPVTRTWTSKTVLSAQRWGAVAAANSRDEILVFGGVTAGPALTGSHEKFNPANNTWSSLAAMNLPRSGHAGASVSNDFLNAFGGLSSIDSPQPPSNTNQEYDPFANVWRARTVVPAQIKFAAAASIRDKVHVVGGMDSAGAVLSNNLQYKPLMTTKALQAGFGVEYTTGE